MGAAGWRPIRRVYTSGRIPANTSIPSRKNGRFSGKNSLERRQVQDHGVGLDLTEVGVQRQLQGQLVADVRAGVEPDRPAGRPAVGQRVGVDVGRAVAGAPEHERPQLEGVARVEIAQVVEPAEQRHEGRGAARVERPVVGLLARVDEAAHLEPPVLHRQRREPQHRQRDAELDRVAASGVGDLGFPHGVPVAGEGGVVEVDPVGQHAGGVDGEVERAHAGAAAVDVDPDAVGRDLRVAAREPAHDGRVQLLAVDADVEVLVVVQHPHRRALAGRRALVREVLHELVRRRGRGPGRIVEAAVDDGRLRGPRRGDVRAGRQRARWRRARRRRGWRRRGWRRRAWRRRAWQRRAGIRRPAPGRTRARERWRRATRTAGIV